MSQRFIPRAFFILGVALITAFIAERSQSSESATNEASPIEAQRDARPVLKFACLEYPPYVGAKLPSKGYVTEIIESACDRAGYRVESTFYPWERTYALGQSGKVDGIFTIWHRKEREEWFLYSEELPANEIGFFKRSDSDITFETLKDLSPYTIGTVRGYSNPREFKEADYLKKSPGKDDLQNMRKLLAGRLDLVLIDRGVAEHLIAKHFLDKKDQLDWINRPIERLPQHICFPKKSKNAAELHRKFNAALAELRESGEIDRILEKHGVDPSTY